MKTFLVGGAVRDELLGCIPKDKDYVIVGASTYDIQGLVDSGYQQVGADFPVYLHPITKAEYALARTERKSGSGYLGFEVDTQGLNPLLLKKFIDLGFNLDEEYDYAVLFQVSQHINR